MVDENRTDGFVKDIGGKVKDSVGGLTGDASMQASGKVDQATGKMQGMFGKATDGARDFTSDTPILAVLGASCVGLVIGFLLARR